MPTLTYTPGILAPVTDPLTAQMGGGTQTLTVVPFTRNGATDLPAVLTAATGVTLQFTNTGQEILLVQAAAGATVTVDIGVTILGQPVANFPAVTLTSGHVYVFGPFSSLLNTPGTGIVKVTLSAITSTQVALLQMLAYS